MPITQIGISRRILSGERAGAGQEVLQECVMINRESGLSVVQAVMSTRQKQRGGHLVAPACP